MQTRYWFWSPYRVWLVLIHYKYFVIFNSHFIWEFCPLNVWVKTLKHANELMTVLLYTNSGGGWAPENFQPYTQIKIYLLHVSMCKPMSFIWEDTYVLSRPAEVHGQLFFTETPNDECARPRKAVSRNKYEQCTRKARCKYRY